MPELKHSKRFITDIFTDMFLKNIILPIALLGRYIMALGQRARLTMLTALDQTTELKI